MARIFSLLLMLGLFLAVFSSCSKDDDPKPDTNNSVLAAQLAQKWRLDELYTNSQLSASGSSIKDRYTIQFRAGGTYTQTLLANGTAYNGTWTLEEGTTVVLHLIDHKGAPQDYVVGQVDNQNLRYARVNDKGELVEYRFASVL